MLWMPVRARCFATLCALILCFFAERPAEADDAKAPVEPIEIPEEPTPGQKLGSYERLALRNALRARGLTLEEEPDGKLIDRVHVVNLDVFGKGEGMLRLLNFFHFTTREHVIRREVLLQPGDPWNLKRLQESQRRLKDPLFTSLAVVVPVKSETAGRVSILAVTRDIFSLRMNSSFEYTQGLLTGLQLSIAENNIFGLRKHGSFVFDMNQGNYLLGPQYIDKALGGTRLRLTSRFSAIFSRETSEFEGTSSGTSLSYPLWSLATKWGGDVSVTHSNFISRAFLGTELETVDDPNTPEVEELPRVFSVRSVRVTSRLNRSFGLDVKQNWSFGHSLSVFRPDFVDGFEATPAERDAFASLVFPRSERLSSVFASYRLFTPDFVIYRNLNSFDLAEDIRLGPDVNVGVSVALKALGSEVNFVSPDFSASYVHDLGGDGFARIATSASSRIQDGEAVDNISQSAIKIASPRIADLLRIVGQVDLGIRLRERGNGRFRLGGENGLRGYLINEFSGQKQLLTNLEVRSMPLRFLFMRAGGLVFWDMGHTADRLEQLSMKHSVGFGLRTLVPQLQPIVFRFDWAFPLAEPSGGFPGRISAGVAQVF